VTRERADALADELALRGVESIDLMVVLGSGLGAFSDALENACVIPGAELEHLPRSAVPGHAGRIVFGELDGVRILGPRTVDYMTQNHLPGGTDLETFGRPLFAESSYDGVGFGLGFSVQLDPAANKVLSSPGEFAWGGAASTAFWCDPHEDIAVVFLTQLLPSSTHPIRPQLKQLVYQALVD